MQIDNDVVRALGSPYLVVTAIFVVGWLPNAGQPLPRGLFWPIVPIVALGVGLVGRPSHGNALMTKGGIRWRSYSQDSSSLRTGSSRP